jgi:hypothetical protein
VGEQRRHLLARAGALIQRARYAGSRGAQQLIPGRQLLRLVERYGLSLEKNE